METFTSKDIAYIKANFFTIEELCAGRDESPSALRQAIHAGKLPQAAYVTDDGEEWFPASYLDVVDEAGGLESLQPYFIARIVQLGGDRESADSAWSDYLSGGYAWCLREVTPDSIMRKAKLADSVGQLLANPQPNEALWRQALRRDVWALDAIERPFLPDFDRRTDRPGVLGTSGRLPTRDRLVAHPREQYPEVFAV